LQGRTGIIPLSSTQDIGGPLGRTVTDIAIVLDAIVGYDPADPQTADSVGNIPKSYTDSLQLTGLRGSRIGLVTDLLGSDPADAEVATILRAALTEMKAQGAEIFDVGIPGLDELLTDRLGGFLIIRYEFKANFDSYLAAYPNAPVHSLGEAWPATNIILQCGSGCFCHKQSSPETLRNISSTSRNAISCGRPS
jgi:amidase